MSDIGRYYGSYDIAKSHESNGNILMAAIEYWMCTQFADHGEFPVLPDISLATKAAYKTKKLQSKLPFAPLSKTTFIKGCQCLKALWLYRNKYDQRYVSPEVQQKFKVGHIIGELAQKLFPGGFDASLFESLQSRLQSLQGRTPLQVPNLPYRLKQNLWLHQTQQAIKQNKEYIYEAAFTYDDVFAAVDILHVGVDGNIAYEVKSSFDVKDVYIHDSALQYYVISHNIDLADMFLVYPNEEYVNSLGIELEKLTVHNCDLERLFIKKPILSEVLTMQKQIKDELKAIKPILSQRNEPQIDVGDQCTNPYECEFKKYCTNDFPDWYYGGY